MKNRWYVYMEEMPGGDEGAAAGSAAVESAVPAEVKTVDMAAAISEGLGYDKAKTLPEDKAADAAKIAEEQATKERDAKAAAGDPAALQAKKDAEAQAAADAAKPKDLKALELSPADKKAMLPATAARFEKVLTAAKEERARAETAETQVQHLSQAREAIMGVLRETNTSDQDLAQLLEFNRLVKSGTPQGLEQALAVIDQHRVNLLRALGREGDGYDPLAEHPDLAKDVAENKVTKERALEIVAARKREAINAAQQSRGDQARQSQQQVEQAHQQGLSDIEKWAAEISRSDIDYKPKEEKIIAEIGGIIKDYPPNLWLPTIKRVYASIAVNKAAPALPSSNGAQPLRSSGAKPGNAAPTSMVEAISQGLGYVKA